MDYDTSSFEDVSSSNGKKFIALVVSDASDFDDSGILDVHETQRVDENQSTPIKKIDIKKKSNKPQMDSTPPIVLRRPKSHKKNYDATKRYSMILPDTKIDFSSGQSSTPLAKSHHNGNTSSNSINNTPKSEDKKRWSFMSNHSSSSKKRWSTLSSFTIESVGSGNLSNNNNNSPGNRTSTHSSSKRFSTASNISVATTTTSTNNTDVISFQHKNTSIDNISNHTRKSSSSMKRSSTGSSLRQFLTNFVTPTGEHILNNNNSEHLNTQHLDQHSNNSTNNKENQYSSNSNKTHHDKKSNKLTQKRNSISHVIQVDSRRPLQRISVNDTYVNPQTNTENSNRLSRHYDNSSLYNLTDQTNQLNQSMENLSLRSKRSSTSSMSSSSSLSKWKFWKKNSNSYNNQHNHHNYNNTQSQQHDYGQRHSLKNTTSSTSISVSSLNKTDDKRSSSHQHHSLTQSHSSRTLHAQLNERPLSTYSHETNKLRSKNSLSDFHKSFYKSGNGSIATSIHNITDYKSEFSFYSNMDHPNVNNTSSTAMITTSNCNNNMTVKKKSSTSSLSIHGLKHRTSQHSLKHKTSHSSLQKFKTRRKSNNDDGSSFLTTSSSINSNHSGSSSNPKISLPIPNQVSRDKIRTKLRNSTSLLSLNSTTPVEKKKYDETILNQLLELCSVKYLIDYIELDSEIHRQLETLSSNHSIQLSNNVWRSTSTLDPSQTVICKKRVLSNDNDDIILKELQMLTLCKRTPGLPQLLQSYIVTNNNHENILYMFVKDHGNPITEINMTTWSQCLKIFWQCVSILYVAETKFQFEHRNLTLNHILVDKNSTVTLCDLSMSRAQYGKDMILFTRLDHPVFFQGGHEHLFDTYHAMRSVFIQHGEQWSNFEPRTNLLWLKYLAMSFLIKNKDLQRTMGPGREQLTKLVTLLDHHSSFNGSNKRGSHLFNKRKEHEVKSTGDLFRYKSIQ